MQPNAEEINKICNTYIKNFSTFPDVMNVKRFVKNCVKTMDHSFYKVELFRVNKGFVNNPVVVFHYEKNRVKVMAKTLNQRTGITPDLIISGKIRNDLEREVIFGQINNLEYISYMVFEAVDTTRDILRHIHLNIVLDNYNDDPAIVLYKNGRKYYSKIYIRDNCYIENLYKGKTKSYESVIGLKENESVHIIYKMIDNKLVVTNMSIKTLETLETRISFKDYMKVSRYVITISNDSKNSKYYLYDTKDNGFSFMAHILGRFVDSDESYHFRNNGTFKRAYTRYFSSPYRRITKAEYRLKQREKQVIENLEKEHHNMNLSI